MFFLLQVSLLKPFYLLVKRLAKVPSKFFTYKCLKVIFRFKEVPVYTICDAHWETISKGGKIKTPLFYDVCERGSFSEYFQTSLSLLGAKLIKIKWFEVNKRSQSCGSFIKAYCFCIHVNPGCMVCVENRNKSCIV